MNKLTLLLLGLFTVTTVFSQKTWVSFTGTQQPEQTALSIQQSDRSGMTIEVNVPGMYLQELTHEDMTFQRISLFDGKTTKAVGRPELPRMNEVIGIPGNMEVSYEILSMETTMLSGYNIYPFQTPTTDNPGGHDKEFVMDRAFYSKDAVWPSENVVMSRPQIWRDVKLTNLHVTPFSYNPATQELTAVTKLVIKVEFSGLDVSVDFNPDMELTPKFYNMYEAAIPNFGDLGYTMTLREETGIKYLVITNQEALEAIQPLVDWKNQMGHKVEVKTLEPGFDEPADFKAYISGLYDSDGLEYVLMVGDAYPDGGSNGGPNVVPMFWWSPGGSEDPSYSDSWYTCLDGPDDHYADLAIGRFVYNENQLDELELQINKTLTHYMAPDDSDNWAENTILIAHKENYPGKYTQCCNEIADFPYSIQTPNFEKAYGGEGYTNAEVVEFVNETGVGIFNYRGHGSQTQLWDWTNYGPSHFTAAEVAQLNNVDRLFVFFDVCCDNMDIVGYSGDCLCESFMKHETGSVAVNGAIIPSYTDPNHDYDKEMYKAVFEENITNIGYVTNFANITVLNIHGNIGRSNVRTYLWLGDASIEPWTKQPTELTVTHDEQLFLGVSEFAVNVIANGEPAENAMVCVSNDEGSVYAVAYADESGLATVVFDELVQTPGDVTVTVTLHNFLPYQGTIPVTPQEGPYVIEDSYIINDASGNGNGLMDYAESILLSLSVKNVGVQTAENVTVTMSTEDEYITITDGEETYGNVEPDEVVTINDGFAFDVAEDIPDGHAVLFNVSATDGTDTWTSEAIVTGHAPILELGDFTISDPTGNNNGKLDPGEVATMTVTVLNSGTADAYEVYGELMTDDTYLEINSTDPQLYGVISALGEGTASFEVSADGDTPAGHIAGLDFEMYGDHEIAGSGSFGIVIGQISVVIIDLDDNTSSGPELQQAIANMDISVEYTTSIPDNMLLYSSAFVCLGIYYENYALTSGEGQQLADFLDAGRMLYMEGGDAWYFDDQTAVHEMFNIEAVADGSGDLGTINGMPGTFTEGMSFDYTGENNWIDQIAPIGSAQLILENSSPNYGTAVAYDGGSYRTIGASHEFSGLDNTNGSREDLMTEYLTFFGIINTGVTANFAGDATQICEGEEVTYTDYSSGNITEWYWEFEGGDPATSTGQNPTVMYMQGGDWDVSLTVTGENGSNTMSREDYITTMFMPESAGDIIGNDETCQGYEEVYSVDEISWADTYNWVLEPEEAGEMTMEENEATIMISEDYEGEATLKVCGGNQCGEGGWSDEFSIIVNTCVGIDENGSSLMAIYPNPSTGQFTLDLTANDVVNVRVMNAIGEVVYETNDLTVDGRTTTSIDLNGLAEGVYYLKLEGNKTNMFEKIVIAR